MLSTTPWLHWRRCWNSSNLSVAFNGHLQICWTWTVHHEIAKNKFLNLFLYVHHYEELISNSPILLSLSLWKHSFQSPILLYHFVSNLITQQILDGKMQPTFWFKRIYGGEIWPIVSPTFAWYVTLVTSISNCWYWHAI